MTYSTLASIVKYPYSSALAGAKSKFGFFTAEQTDFCHIAETLGMRPGTVSVRLNRMRNSLKHYLNKEGFAL